MPVKPPSQSPPRQPLHWETIQKKRLTTSGKWMPGTAWWWWRWWVSLAAMRGEGGEVRCFHILALYLIIICYKKACGPSWKICQQWSISPSSGLYFLSACCHLDYVFLPYTDTWKKSTSLVVWAQISQDTASKALKLLPSLLAPCSDRTGG